MALTDKLTAIANAIRGKTGGTDKLTLDEMASEIEGITTGGGDDVAKGIIERTITEISDSTVTQVGGRAFYDCRALTSVNLPAATSIGDYAFYDCRALTSVNLPAATSIGGYAFYDCSALTSVNLPAATNIGSQAFYGCEALTSVILPAATSIGSGAFQRCEALPSVNLPAATSIGSKAFYGCSVLSVLVLRSTSVCVLSNTSAFTSTPFESGGTGGTVYVPEALIESYKKATNWSTLYEAGTCNFVAIEGSEYE